VNKLIVNNSYDVKGNTVLNPNIGIKRSSRQEDEYERIRRSQIEKRNRLKYKKNKKKRQLLASIITIFICGMGVILGQSKVYAVQRNLSQINKEISAINVENDNLKVELVKTVNLQSIKNVSDKLEMVNVDNSKIMYIDLDKNNFAPKQDKEQGFSKWLGNLKKILF
jgi:cell division protein FtsL